MGHEVFIITFDSRQSQDDPYTIHLGRVELASGLLNRVAFKLSPARAFYMSASSSLLSAVHRLSGNNFLDVLEIEESFGWSYEISRRKLLPVVVRLHGPWFLNGGFDVNVRPSAAEKRRERLEGVGIRHAQFVTSPSITILQAVKRHYKFDLNASTVIPNPIRPAVKAAAWNITTCDRERLLFVGRFNRRKGGDLTLLAFAELACRYPRLKLTFVGPDDGVDQLGDKKYSVQEFARAYLPSSARSRVEFMGKMARSEIDLLRTQCFATIVASRYEIAPYSVLETMSFGCPLIATAVGGIPELIQDQRNGLLVAPGDVGGLVTACKNLLDNPGLAVQLSGQAWRDCCELYSPTKIARQTIEGYKQAIRAFHAGR
jgi:glycosyltransferase involved in cell wall biosynthesis